jgi:AAA15 family ATPase/GTPase
MHTQFQNATRTVQGAQLIFNTHNPIFLNANLFRRDEIKFVEREGDTHASVHYALADFGTAGKRGVRKNEDYLKNYFISQYGAISDVDFTPVFESLLEGRKEV